MIRLKGKQNDRLTLSEQEGILSHGTSVYDLQPRTWQLHMAHNLPVEGLPQASAPVGMLRVKCSILQ